MSTNTETQTTSVLVIAPGRATEDREVTVGTKISELAEELGIEAAEAYDAMNQKLDGDAEITPETEVVNFVVRLAGALS